MRLIDADALLEELKKTGRYFQSKFDIENAPTVELTEEQAIDKLHETGWLPRHDKEMTERPQGEWIPVSERLPEYSGLYLISVDDLVTVANFTGTYFMHRGGGMVKVYAWQPLPEPYKKGGAK